MGNSLLIGGFGASGSSTPPAPTNIIWDEPNDLVIPTQDALTCRAGNKRLIPFTVQAVTGTIRFDETATQQVQVLGTDGVTPVAGYESPVDVTGFQGKPDTTIQAEHYVDTTGYTVGTYTVRFTLHVLGDDGTSRRLTGERLLVVE